MASNRGGPLKRMRSSCPIVIDSSDESDASTVVEGTPPQTPVPAAPGTPEDDKRVRFELPETPVQPTAGGDGDTPRPNPKRVRLEVQRNSEEVLNNVK